MWTLAWGARHGAPDAGRGRRADRSRWASQAEAASTIATSSGSGALAGEDPWKTPLVLDSQWSPNAGPRAGPCDARRGAVARTRMPVGGQVPRRTARCDVGEKPGRWSVEKGGAKQRSSGGVHSVYAAVESKRATAGDWRGEWRERHKPRAQISSRCQGTNRCSQHDVGHLKFEAVNALLGKRLEHALGVKPQCPANPVARDDTARDQPMDCPRIAAQHAGHLSRICCPCRGRVE
jgi:hypothetical protein